MIIQQYLALSLFPYEIMNNNMNYAWYKCPGCGKKMFKVRPDTVLRKFPGYCKRCKKEYLITLEPRAE